MLAAITDAMSGRRSATRTLTSTWGKEVMTAAASARRCPAAWAAANTCTPVSRPSPVVARSGKITCPDCSPPSDQPPRARASST